MLDFMRTSLYRVIATKKGDELAVLRVQKDLARRLNTTLGSPLCSRDELDKRRNADARLAALKTTRARPTPREPAPVTVYFDRDRNPRLVERVKELLDAKEVHYRLCDVAGDEATLLFVMSKAGCKDDDLPIVFIASDVVGGYNDLVQWNLDGRLARSVFGA